MAPTIGLDLGGTKLLAGVVEEDGTVLKSERRRVAGLPLDELLEVVHEVLATLDTDAPIGVGVPALVDRRTGIVVGCNHLPLVGMHVVDTFGAVATDNDANCAVLAEWQLGAGRGCSHVVLLTLGTGIGGGLVLDGRVYHGSIGAAAELGHVPIDLDGPPCFGNCPGRGCLEALCSGSALARDGSERLGREVTGEEVTQLALAGDPDACAVMHSIGTKLGVGLAGIAMTFNPELIVVGGGAVAAGELMLGPAREELRRRAREPSCTVRVETAALGERAGMIGAALLARRTLDGIPS